MSTFNNDLELSRIDYLILTALITKNAIAPVFGTTIKELEITEVKRSCLSKHLKRLIECNFVCQSGKYQKQKMYYITQSGVNQIKIK